MFNNNLAMDHLRSPLMITVSLGGEHQVADLEGGENSDGKCSDRTRKIGRGILLTALIALAWVGTLHLLKFCFLVGQGGFKDSIAARFFDSEQFSGDSNDNNSSSEQPSRLPLKSVI